MRAPSGRAFLSDVHFIKACMTQAGYRFTY